MIDLKLPAKGFTKAERAWLQELIDAINTVQAVQGRNCTVSDAPDGSGQTINADDCTPCP